MSTPGVLDPGALDNFPFPFLFFVLALFEQFSGISSMIKGLLVKLVNILGNIICMQTRNTIGIYSDYGKLSIKFIMILKRKDSIDRAAGAPRLLAA